jgi:NADH-quinone oxidoreductase subunit A
MDTMLPLGAVDVGMNGHFATVLIFVLIGFFFAAVALIVAKLLRPHDPHPAKLTTYECGEDARGSSWVRFNVRFYLIALFFIVFDVEVIFLYPWAVVFKQLFPLPELGALVFWEMVIFLVILSLGLAYIWVKGDLDWVKKLVERDPSELPGASPLLRPVTDEEGAQ